jgi:hypothetical protein
MSESCRARPLGTVPRRPQLTPCAWAVSFGQRKPRRLGRVFRSGCNLEPMAAGEYRPCAMIVFVSVTDREATTDCGGAARALHKNGADRLDGWRRHGATEASADPDAAIRDAGARRFDEVFR